MSGQHCKNYDANGKQFTVTCEMFTAVARDQRWPDVVSGISAHFSKFALFCYMCLNQVYKSAASTFAINDQLKEFKVNTKERLVNDQGLVLFAQWSPASIFFLLITQWSKCVSSSHLNRIEISFTPLVN